MPKKVTKAQRRISRQLPIATINRGNEVIVELRPPGENLGEPMPKPDSKGKVPATEDDLIVWNNRQVVQ